MPDVRFGSCITTNLDIPFEVSLEKVGNRRQAVDCLRTFAEC